MDRHKAIAVAAAITMSLTSGLIAVGANVGALGFGGASRVSAPTQVSGVARAQGAPSASPSSVQQRERDDSARAIESGADSAASARGENNG